MNFGEIICGQRVAQKSVPFPSPSRSSTLIPRIQINTAILVVKRALETKRAIEFAVHCGFLKHKLQSLILVALSPIDRFIIARIGGNNATCEKQLN
jgi:hypothetical protein